MQPPKKKRRVPESERQRVASSCDRCKTRKIRCIRLADDASIEQCAPCAQLGLVCATTLPRKQKVHARYGELQQRYRTLEAVVKRMFPDADLDSIDDIRELARNQGVDLAELDDDAGSPEFVSKEGESDERLFSSVQELEIPEGASIPAPRGGYHYVGPASSYLFANTIRHLVKKSSIYTMSFDNAGHRRQRRANEFTSSKRTTALEARIHGHPVTVAATEGASPLSENVVPSPQDRRSWTVELLPPRRLSDKLVKAFFDRVHPDFNVFHRGSWQVRYESFWSVGSKPDEADGETGWLYVLYMVYVLGAQALERDRLPEARAVQGKYLALVIHEGLQRLVLTATHSNVQALALLGLYQHNAGERNTAWMLVGHAARMGVALGMQRDGEHSNFDYIVRNSRRMIWWTLYLYEQNLSFILGRPSATSTLDISASLPDEAVLDGGNAPPGFLEQAVKLGAISAKIKRFVASVSTDFDKPDRLARKADMGAQLDSILNQWLRALPPHLQASAHFATTKHLRAVLLLHANLFHLRSVVGRPFLLCDVNHHLDTVQSPVAVMSQALPANITPLSKSSVDNARQCLETLLKLSNSGALEGELWHDFYFVHHSSLILSLPFLIRPDDTQSPDRGLVSTALNIARKSRLAPTYQILVNVSIQFAKIVGIGPDDDPSRPSSPRGGVPPDFDTNWAQQPVSHERGSLPDTPIQWGMPPVASSSDAPSWSMLPVLQSSPSNQALSLEQLLGMPHSLAPPAPDLTFSDLHNFGFGISAAPASGTVEGDAGVTFGTDVPWDFFAGDDWSGFAGGDGQAQG